MSSRSYDELKLFQWLRNSVFKVEKPHALPWGEWEKWDKEFKKSRPVAFFLTQTLPDCLEWIPEHSVDYLNNVRFYFSNVRYNTHGLNSTLKVGEWHEFQERVLYSLFDSYVDFIEIEEASNHIAWADDEDAKKYKISWLSRLYWTRVFKPFRCPQAGIDHLKWEMTLDTPPEDNKDPWWTPSTYQAETAREKMALYTWWKLIRPARGDAWEVTGFRAHWNAMDAKYGDGEWLGLAGSPLLTVAEKKLYDVLHEKVDALEKEWGDEDDQMLIRLIKIRKSLWT